MTRVRFAQFIDGQDLDSGNDIDVINPSDTSEVVGTVNNGTEHEVELAVAAASRAGVEWAQTSPSHRVQVLNDIADRIEAEAEELAQLTARENGSVLSIVQGEIVGAAKFFRETAGFLEDELAPTIHGANPLAPNVKVSRKPFGVVAAIVPWNAPLILTVKKLAPAIATGNSVVLKPSLLAPLGVTMMGRIVASLLPRGVINIVNGGRVVGAAMIDSKEVRKISFTGGGETARSIMRQAAEQLKGVHFELGGNDPAIVLSDADLPMAVERIVRSAFRRAGQVCYAVKRVYVPRHLAAEFRELIVQEVRKIRVGSAIDPRATMGPLSNPEQVKKVTGLRDQAISLGRDVRELGEILSPEDWARGYFVRPTLVLDAEHGDEIVRDEQFGPILPIISYDSEEEAISMANDSEFGLCASVWSASHMHAQEVANRLHVGMAIVNNHFFSEVGNREIPFGGWKQSGIGWEGSPHGLGEYLQFHSIDVQS